MRIGTVGTGAIVAQFIAAAQSVSGVSVSGVYSRDRQRAQAFAQQHNVGAAYDRYDALLADNHIDVIYIASPNSLHFHHCQQALMAGKHVICEKPFTSTAIELRELIALAKRQGVMLFEAISVVHMPNFALIRRHLAALGRIRLVQCNYSQFSSKYPAFLAGEQPNVFNPAFSGGALMDINIYNLHFVSALFGMPQQVNYAANITEGIDTSGIVTLRYADFVAVCSGAKDSFSLNFAQIQGEKGYLNVVDGINGCAQIHLQTAQGAETLNVQQPGNRLVPEVQVFSDMFAQQRYEDCYCGLAQSLAVMDILDAARHSAGLVFSADRAH